ncbi:Lipocalin-like domain-containing protein [Chitinophaga jiangningensis]|uniref:Lipocalin-like domain-containing protein n=1 Tax=Chitinophaga jiangningensis TaxID=1419482 RepID=A0A1M7HXH9_9BACT|nr:lipocalin family protein [Chitinophaga jiangningensis]SHM33118.1 Lipocalin-like domain-containing protein [Chitinophaga jiangningensis]
MKNLSFAAVLLAMIAIIGSACTPKQGVTTDINKAAVKGNWVLTDVKYEGIPDNAKVTVFDQAEAKCFIGSQWVLPDNAAMGSYTLSASDNACAPASQKIVWSIFKGANGMQFQFKKLYSGEKAKNVTDGYRVDILGAGSTMTWRANVNFEGNNAAIIYTLQRQ